MKIKYHILLATQLNQALGDNNTLDIEETKNSLQDDTLFEYLTKKLSTNMDLSNYSPQDKSELISQLRDMSDTHIDHHLGVKNNGLTMLVAYLLELVKREISKG